VPPGRQCALGQIQPKQPRFARRGAHPNARRTREPRDAGDLVEQQSTLAGGTWQTSALCLQGLSLVRRNGEYHHFDVLGTVGVVTDAGGTVLSSDLFDAFGVLRHAQGQAATPWRWLGRKLAEEGLLAACGGAYQLPTRALPAQKQNGKFFKCFAQCRFEMCRDVGIPRQKCGGMCAVLCGYFAGHGCDWLYNKCFSYPKGTWWAKLCMTIYLGLCFGE